jgi:AraC-like DNA-binding protein
MLNHRSLVRGRALRFPCERSIGFHVVAQGELFLHPIGEPRIALRNGDLALMARGRDHVISTEPKYDARSVELAAFASAEHGIDARARRERPRAQVVGGAYQFWNKPVHPLFDELPDWYVLRGDALVQLDHLHFAIGLLRHEASQPGLGSDSVVYGLLDVIFTYLVRRIVAERGETRATWCHAVQDEPIRRTIELMHDECAHDWTLAGLARKAGMSRAGFAAKFRGAMGEPPLHYLRTVRMQRAMSLLSETPDTLEKVARAVGYRDAFGFSKVFKKVVGVSPREFRTRDREDRKLAFRL